MSAGSDEEKDQILNVALDLELAPFPGPAMVRPCKDCPFVCEKNGKGYLAPKRLLNIKSLVAFGYPFWCHKSVYVRKTEYDKDGEPANYGPHYKMCRGALDWFASALALRAKKSSK